MIETSEKNKTDEKIKVYQNNRELTEDIAKRVVSILDSTKNQVLDLGNDKPPQNAIRLAEKYPDSHITYFKDIKTFGRINDVYKKDNITYVFDKRRLEKNFFNVATAVFSLHEYPKKWRKPELKILHKALKQNGKIVVIGYDLQWVPNENISEEDFKEHIFTDGNERKIMKKEPNCMQRHTSYGLEDCIEDCSSVGFNEILTEKYHIETPWGIKPKIFLYLGEKAS